MWLKIEWMSFKFANNYHFKKSITLILCMTYIRIQIIIIIHVHNTSYSYINIPTITFDKQWLELELADWIVSGSSSVVSWKESVCFSVDFIANIMPLGGFFLINFSIYHTYIYLYLSVIISIVMYEEIPLVNSYHFL